MRPPSVSCARWRSHWIAACVQSGRSGLGSTLWRVFFWNAGRAADDAVPSARRWSPLAEAGDVMATWDASVWPASSWTDAGQLVRAEEVCGKPRRACCLIGARRWVTAVHANIRLGNGASTSRRSSRATVVRLSSCYTACHDPPR